MPMVQISMISGRTKEQKAALAQDVTEAVMKHTGASRDGTSVMFIEVDRDSWAVGGTLLSDR